MARPLRLEFANALYHVTARGDRREPIFRDDNDRLNLLELLGLALARFNAKVYAYCLMGNHYHLVLHTAEANLSRLMRHVNGVYTQRFNRRHDLVGHLFQGRFGAIHVDREPYLLSLCRYVERNPVAAGFVSTAGEWRWSSYRAHVLRAQAPAWLDVSGLHGLLLHRPAQTLSDRRAAATRYASMMGEAVDQPLWASGLRKQVFLGDEAFADRLLRQAPVVTVAAREIPRQQRCIDAMSPEWPGEGAERGQAMREAYVRGGLTMSEIGRRCGLSVSRISRLIAAAEIAAEAQAAARDEAGPEGEL